MNEVAARVMLLHLRRLAEKGLPPERLLRGTGWTSAALHRSNARMDWGTYATMMENVRGVFSHEELVAIGRDFIAETPYLSVLAGQLVSPLGFYEWLFRKGVGSPEFRCVRTRIERVGRTALVFRAELAEPHRPVPEWFVISGGAFEAMPRLLGRPLARVELEMLGPRTARYTIVPPSDRTLAATLRRLLRPPRAQPDERMLKETVDALRRHATELEQAYGTLREQALLLTRLQALTTRALACFGLAATLEALVTTLLEAPTFGAAQVLLDDAPGGPRETRRGAPTAVAPLERRLESARGRLGTLRLWPRTEDDADHAIGLADSLTPAVALAIEHALAYEALSVEQERLRTANEAARRLAEAAASANEDERRKLALALHDGAQQAIAAAALQVDTIADQAADPSHVAALRRVQRFLTDVNADLRRLAHDLHPATLERLGLEDALRDLAAATSSASLAVGVVILEPLAGQLSPAMTLMAFRVAQAALHNVVVHSGARSAVVRVAVSDSHVALEIEDDGCGFDPAPASAAGWGLGIRGMRERAAWLGAELEVASTPHVGTRIVLRIPRSGGAP